MKRPLIYIISLLSAVFSLCAAPSSRVSLDTGWTVSHGSSKAVAVSLPHDWSIHHNFDSLAPAGNDGAYLPTGSTPVTYTRSIQLDSILPGTWMLYIEGAYMDSEVVVNDEIADGHPYGFSSYRVDITPMLVKGENKIEITVDNTDQKNCRWYTGTGLYRPVWLEHYDPVYIEPWSMVFSSPGIRPGMAIGRVDATVLDTDSERVTPETYVATLYVTAPDGSVTPHSTRLMMGANERVLPVHIDFPIADPALWSPSTPNVYTATLELANADGVVARDEIEFGLRTIDFDADEGFFLNDEPIVIYGACVHHDNGLLGAASFPPAEWRKAELLKEAGFNAVRCAHNPPSTAFLKACDHLGLMVIDEAFDNWRAPKNDNDYSVYFEQYFEDDLSKMLLRDRNHPSVIAWSIGNEIIERKSPEAVAIADRMARICRELDPFRPVTQALAAWDDDWEIYDSLAARHDIVGYNYMIHKAESDHQRVPDRVMWQTESYPRDAFKNYIMVRDHPYVIGDFVWTGIDYLGESGIGRHYYDGQVPGEHYERNLWPWHGSLCGDIDLIGRRKPVSYYRSMLFTGAPTLYMAVREPDGYKGNIRQTMWGTYPTCESWNWPGWEGKNIEVEVISNFPRVALYLNDKLVDTKKISEATEYKAVFSVPYAPGTLRAVALDNSGNRLDEFEILTASQPVEVKLDTKRYSTDDVDYDIIYVTASIVDSDGVVNPLATDVLTFSVTPNAEILATGTADMTDLVGYHVKSRVPCQGRAQAVIKAPRNSFPTVTVNSASLPVATILVVK